VRVTGGLKRPALVCPATPQSAFRRELANFGDGRVEARSDLANA
jgi:hypothetical protein